MELYQRFFFFFFFYSSVCLSLSPPPFSLHPPLSTLLPLTRGAIPGKKQNKNQQQKNQN